jgi:hypothetical protein
MAAALVDDYPVRNGTNINAVEDRVASTQPTSSLTTMPAASTTVEPNVKNVVLGDLQIKPWYPSFYPEELVGSTTERLYVCQWCFRYSVQLMGFLGHVVSSTTDAFCTSASVCMQLLISTVHKKVCPLKDRPPPGMLIYSSNGYSMYEIDGEEHRLYTQNLSLFAKLFLDTKSVFYDVTTFLYYVLVSDDPTPTQPVSNTGSFNTTLSSSQGSSTTAKDAERRAQRQSQLGGSNGQVVGFFSKEKLSWDNNNLACILVFPPWQRKGLGQILMGVSYELSKREQKLGGPEKRKFPILQNRWSEANVLECVL